MDRVNAWSRLRRISCSPLEPIPPEIWTCIVVKHIALREGRAITSLACVSRLFALWTKPHLRPVALYRELQGAAGGAPRVALHQAMSTLYDLADIDEAHRLELFLLVSDTLQHRFPGVAIAPHIDALLGGMERLTWPDQQAALLHIMTNHGLGPNVLTVPRYLRIAGRIGALPPSPSRPD